MYCAICLDFYHGDGREGGRGKTDSKRGSERDRHMDGEEETDSDRETALRRDKNRDFQETPPRGVQHERTGLRV